MNFNINPKNTLILRFLFFLERIGILKAALICETCGREVDPDNLTRHYISFHPEHPIAQKAIEDALPSGS